MRFWEKNKTTIIVVLILLAIVATLYFTVFRKKSDAEKRQVEPGTGAKPCDRLAPIPPKGSAKGEAGGYCIPPAVDLFGLNPNNPKDRDDIFEWMKFAIENKWTLEGTMGQLATAAAYQVTLRRAGK